MEHITGSLVTEKKVVRLEMRKARDVDGRPVLVKGTNVGDKKFLKLIQKKMSEAATRVHQKRPGGSATELKLFSFNYGTAEACLTKWKELKNPSDLC